MVDVDEPAHAERVLAEVAGRAAASGSARDRARAIVEALRPIFRYDGAFLTLFDPETNRYPPLVREGYGNRTARYLDGSAFAAEIELVGLRGPVPVRSRDLPMPVEDLRVWADYLHPDGFREGFAAGLLTSDGRYVGVLNFNSTDPRPASDALCTLMVRLGPVIADAVDPLRTVSAMAAVVAGAVAGVVVTRAGAVLPMPGLPDHPALAAGSPVLATAVARQVTAPYVSFLSPVPGRTPVTGLIRVTVLAVPVQTPGHLVGAVLLSPPPGVHGLTRRELEVLGALTEGWSNARIAAALAVTDRTVAAHVEHIKAKLNAPSRTVAAVRAARQGIYIPIELSRVGPVPGR